MEVVLTPSSITTFLVTLAALIGALSTIFVVLYKILKWFENQKDQDDKIKRLEEKHNEDMQKSKTEFRVICTGVLACLDGLEQLGCNHNVTKAKSELEEHLNNAAHQ